MASRYLAVLLSGILALDAFPARAMDFARPSLKINGETGAMPLGSGQVFVPRMQSFVLISANGNVASGGLPSLPAALALAEATALKLDDVWRPAAAPEETVRVEAAAALGERGDPDAAAWIGAAAEFDLATEHIRLPETALPERLFSGVEVELFRTYSRQTTLKGQSRGKPGDWEQAWFRSKIPAPEKPMIVRYPSSGKGRCAYGHAIIWGFHFTDRDSKFSVELGPEEIVKFGLLTEAEKQGLQKEHASRARIANAEHSELKAIMRPENLARLRAMPRHRDAGHQRQLRALESLIDAGPTDVMDQHVKLADGSFKRLILKEDLAAYHAALTGVSEAMPSGPAPAKTGARTQPQRLLLEIARAVAAAARGDFSVWDAIAPRYSHGLEYLAAFAIKVAALFRLIMLAGNGIDGGKPLNGPRRWAFLGAGPAIGERALAKIGLREGQEVYNYDASAAMGREGTAAVEAQGASEGRHSHQIDILKEKIPVEDGFFDVVETGLFESISDPEERARLLGEINRVLDHGGYLLITLKHGSASDDFARTLRTYFRFSIIVGGAEGKLRYDPEVEARIAGGEAAVKRLRGQLSSGAMLLAVKNGGVRSEDIAAHRDAVLDGLRSWKEIRQGEATDRVASDPILTDPIAFDYAELARKVRERQAAPAVEHPEVMARSDALFEEMLDGLDLIRQFLPAGVGGLGRVQKDAAVLLKKWREQGLGALSHAERGWLSRVKREWVDANEFQPIFKKGDVEKRLGKEAARPVLAKAYDLRRVRAMGRGVRARDDGLLSLSLLRNALGEIRDAERREASPWGLTLREAMRQYVPNASERGLIARTLPGDILVITMAWRTWKVGGEFLERLKVPNARWQDSELSMIRQKFNSAWEELAGEEQGEWTLPEMALALRLRAEFWRPIVWADVVRDLPGIEVGLRKVPGDDWENLLTIVFGRPRQRQMHGETHLRPAAPWFDEVFDDLNDFEGMLPSKVRLGIQALMDRRDADDTFIYNELELLRRVRQEWIGRRSSISSSEALRAFPMLEKQLESLRHEDYRDYGGKAWAGEMAAALKSGAIRISMLKRFFKFRERTLRWRHSVRYARMFQNQDGSEASLAADLRSILFFAHGIVAYDADRYNRQLNDGVHLSDRTLRWIRENSLKLE